MYIRNGQNTNEQIQSDIDFITSLHISLWNDNSEIPKILRNATYNKTEKIEEIFTLLQEEKDNYNKEIEEHSNDNFWFQHTSFIIEKLKRKHQSNLDTIISNNKLVISNLRKIFHKYS